MKGASLIGSPVRAFVRDRVQHAEGLSLGAADLWAAYEAWYAFHGYEPMSQQKFGVELKALGYAKWKSCGLIRYRDLQLATPRGVDRRELVEGSNGL